MKKLLLSVALVGFGTFAMAQQTEQTKRTPPTAEQKAQFEAKRADMEKKHMAEMQKDLNLTPDQVNKIQALHDKNKADREGMRQQKMQDIKARREQNDAEMKKILTPEQFQKWQAKKEEMRKENKAKFKEKRMEFKGK